MTRARKMFLWKVLKSLKRLIRLIQGWFYRCKLLDQPFDLRLIKVDPNDWDGNVWIDLIGHLDRPCQKGRSHFLQVVERRLDRPTRPFWPFSITTKLFSARAVGG